MLCSNTVLPHDRLSEVLWDLTLEFGQVVSVMQMSEDAALRRTPLLLNVARGRVRAGDAESWITAI